MITTVRRAASALALTSAVAGLSVMALPGEASAATQSKCSHARSLQGGRGHTVSTCIPVAGPNVAGTKMVNQHRAVIHCDNIRGQGNVHDIRVTLYGPWKNPGQKSEITCPIRSSPAGFDHQTR